MGAHWSGDYSNTKQLNFTLQIKLSCRVINGEKNEVCFWGRLIHLNHHILNEKLHILNNKVASCKMGIILFYYLHQSFKNLLSKRPWEKCIYLLILSWCDSEV